MVVAVDKNVKAKKDNYLCVFDDTATVDELVKTGLHCLHKDFVKYVDINATNYNINCIKKVKHGEKDWDILPDKKEIKKKTTKK